ncbi:ABC transporter permease subunit [Haloterrigena alkaliphila]|uniref:ABC transporter permease n=1 Tax=Haloterrigena alkaliphila TaxID=2816475 RepID=A0A8A2VR72_9EURY|nr:ABC transporter permease subunit [Haloterrigena alkaliphila]QSX00579.1 ABC transporter permease [Haloterrigena alkaliphila]
MSRLATLALFVREDVRDTRRDRQLYLLIGIYAVVGVLLIYSEGRSVGFRSRGPELAPALFVIYTMLTPLLALAFFASSVVEKRTNGALKIVLGLPIDRASVVVGTFVARSLVICGAILVSMIAAVPVGLLVGVGVDPVQFAGVAAVLALLAVTFTALAVGLSAVVSTSTRATVAAFGVFVLFFFQLWDQLPRIALYVRHGFSAPRTTPEWVSIVDALNPMTAYSFLVEGLFPHIRSGTFVSPPRETAFYQEPTFALAVLVGWIVLSVGVGYWRFRATDL